MLASVVSSEDGCCFFYSPDDETHDAATVLTKRQLEIVKLLAEGYSSKFIAEKLFISFNTVNTHRQQIMQKTNVKNTGGLVQFALCHGLI